MKKRMFSKFTNILHQAVEALAPQVPLQEEFVYHWKSVTAYFMDNKGDKMPVDQTSIPVHLNQMIVLLQEEETGTEKGATGPCMEYLLQHKLLETLYSLGRTDHPPGMKQVVLSFFTKLLSRLNHPLLPHVSVHRAVHRMVRACGEIKAAPSETEEIHFLCTVCAKIKEDPYLVNFFIEVPKINFKAPGAAKPVTSPGASQPVATYPDKDIPPETADRVTESSGQPVTSGGDTLDKSSLPMDEEKTQEPQKVSKSKEKPKQEFSLVNSLITLCRSPDSRVAVKACEGLMLCASLPERGAAQCIVEDTAFCTELSQRLVESYLKLPSLVNPASLELVEAKWGLDVITESEDHQTFLGKRHLVSFLSWLDFCDQLINIANPVIGNALAKSIRSLFLDVIMEPSILQTSEAGALLATAYMCRCLRTVNSQPLLNEFTQFLLGTCREPEQAAEENEFCVRKRLIQRCNHLSEDLCLVTLKLFDVLIQKDDEQILNNLVLQNLIGRGYYNEEIVPKSDDVSAAGQPPSTVQGRESSGDAPSVSGECTETCEGTSSDKIKTDTGVTESDLCNGLEKSLSSDSTVTSSESSPSSTPTSPGKGKSEVHKIVNSFLTLLPEDLKSSYQTADSGYDMYLRDAHKQFKDVSMMCEPWKWPENPTADLKYKTEKFYEGDFLRMLLDKLSHMLDQSYAVNLQLTSVMSKLALLPHPNLNEFLLDPFLTTREGVRNLFCVLKKVAHEISVKLSSDIDLGQRLVVARKQLMGLATSIQRLEGQSQLEAIIVMEEFCKELSAIAFVKHHAAVTRS